MVILVVALLILGPDQLPKAMRTIGNAQAQIKKVTGGFKEELQKVMTEVESGGSAAGEVRGDRVDAAAPVRTNVVNGAEPNVGQSVPVE